MFFTRSPPDPSEASEIRSERLIHMAEDKVKFRNTGPVHPLMRQPVATVPYGAKLLYQGLLSMGMPQVRDGGLLD